MATVEQIFEQWQDVRNGLIKEVELIPEEQFGFRATPETRSVLELVQHIIETERVIVHEMCRDNTDFRRGFPTMIAEFAGHVKDATSKEAVLALLGLSLRSLPLGTAYAVWTGIGAVGTVLVGVLWFGDAATFGRLACVFLIVAGIVGLKLCS